MKLSPFKTEHKLFSGRQCKTHTANNYMQRLQNAFDYRIISKVLWPRSPDLKPFIHSFIHSVVCLTTGPLPLPKRLLHRVRSSASSFNFQYLFFSLRSSSSCLRLLPRLAVISILPSNFPSITCFRRQCLRKMWPIQLAFLLFIVCTIFLQF
jgi:hypothetical protein